MYVYVTGTIFHFAEISLPVLKADLPRMICGVSCVLKIDDIVIERLTQRDSLQWVGSGTKKPMYAL